MTDTDSIFKSIAKFGYRQTSESEALASVARAPVGSLVRVEWIDELDSDDMDPGISLNQNGTKQGEIVLITKYLSRSAFRLMEGGPPIVEFECLWRGRLMCSTSSCITEVIDRRDP